MTRIPLKVTYAIMAAVELALRHGHVTAPIQAKVIAKRQAIPARFIEQILNTLKQAGLVGSVRGAQGGYSLSKDPTQVSLAEIVQAVNGTPIVTSPLLNGSVNGIEGRAQHEALLSSVWSKILAAELEILGSISLKALVDQYQQLEQERALMYHI